MRCSSAAALSPAAAWRRATRRWLIGTARRGNPTWPWRGAGEKGCAARQADLNTDTDTAAVSIGGRGEE
jgi:hypothetical protein